MTSVERVKYKVRYIDGLRTSYNRNEPCERIKSLGIPVFMTLPRRVTKTGWLGAFRTVSFPSMAMLQDFLREEIAREEAQLREWAGSKNKRLAAAAIVELL